MYKHKHKVLMYNEIDKSRWVKLPNAISESGYLIKLKMNKTKRNGKKEKEKKEEE